MHRIALAATILGMLSAAAEGQPKIPAGGATAVSFSPEAPVRLFVAPDAQAAGAWIPVEGMPFQRAFQATLTARPQRVWDVRIEVDVERPFAQDDAMLLSFWMRSPHSEDETGAGVANVHVVPGADRASYRATATAGKEWRHWQQPFRVPAGAIPARAQVLLYLGTHPQVVEIADLQLLNYGPDFDMGTLVGPGPGYEGREAGAAWRQEARARIDRIRKAGLEVSVVAAGDTPVQNARVHVAMKRHAFTFGTAVSTRMLSDSPANYPFKSGRRGRKPITFTWEDAQQYRSILASYFNCVTFESALRPSAWERQTKGQAPLKDMHVILTEQAVPWLQSQGIAIRGHYLGWSPMGKISGQDRFIGKTDEHRRWLWNHMADVLPKTPYVSEWDTINHIVGWGKTYESEYGGLDIHAEILAEARRLAPHVLHAVNEGQVLPGGKRREEYEQIIRFLMGKGQTPDAIGFMAHFGSSSLTPPKELLSVYDRFAELVPRLQLTELDVETDDEELQADYLRDCLIASFSHPDMAGIILWGFWQNQHWKPDAALWRSDWTLKPSGQAFVDLVSKEWWTDETLTTGPDGVCRLRGFLGNYSITVESGGKTRTVSVDLERPGKTLQIGLVGD